MSLRIPTSVARALLVLVLTIAGPARANDAKKDCAAAYDEAQSLRDAHKLLDARTKLRVCSSSVCGAFVVKECAAWLAETEALLPSVVLSARDAVDSPLLNVSVLLDGAPFSSKLDGTAVDVDPGRHVFTFVASDGTRAEKDVSVLEGQKAQAVGAVLETKTSTEARAKAAAARAQPPLIHVESTPGQPPKGLLGMPRPAQRIVGVTTAAVGLVGLGVGAVFGAVAAADWSRARSECTTTNCPPANHSQALADHDATSNNGLVSTVALIAGGVLAAAGVTIYFLSPSAERRSQDAALHITSIVTPGRASVLVGGEFQ